MAYQDSKSGVMPAAPSSFRLALDAYVQSKKEREKEKLPQFIQDLQASDNDWTKADVQKAMLELERKNAGRKDVTFVRSVLRPVIRVLTDYSSVVRSLAQADPMPTSVIWGCLLVVINVSLYFLTNF